MLLLNLVFLILVCCFVFFLFDFLVFNFFVCFSGVILKDLTFLHDGNPDVLGENPELINFGKLRQLEEIIEQIQHYQRTPYNFERVPAIQKVIMTTEVWDDIQAYNESLICEDREGKTPAMRGEIVAEHNDTIVNMDLNLTPEQLELAEKTRNKWFVCLPYYCVNFSF